MALNTKISGTGDSAERINEITADDLATLRNYIIGWDSGVISAGETININEVTQVRFTVDFSTGELILTTPEDYQGTEFEIVDNELIATTDERLEKVDLYIQNGFLIAKE